MTISNKPNAGDPIVERIVEDVFGEKFIPTQEFWNFLDELTAQSDQASQIAFDYAATIAAQNARIARIEEEITDNPFTVDSTGWTVDTTYVTADWTKA